MANGVIFTGKKQKLGLLVSWLLTLYAGALADCNGGSTQYKSDEAGTLTSPNWPQNYANSLSCFWDITLGDSSSFQINITSLELEAETGGGSCDNDYLKIASASDSTDVWVKACGNGQRRTIGMPYVIKEKTVTARITFVTNKNLNYTGFRLEWSHVAKDNTTTYIIAGVLGGVGLLGVLFYMYSTHKNKQKVEAERKEYQVTLEKRRKAQREKKVKDDLQKAKLAKEKKKKEQQEKQLQPGQPEKSAASNQGYQPDLAASNIQKVVAEKQRTTFAKPASPVKLPGGKHIMLSYQWDVQEETKKLKERLVRAGHTVWIDIEQMHNYDSTFDSMADAVENAAIVVPVLTQKYQESLNCRKELEYADRCEKRVIPVRMQKKYKPGKWLGFLLGNTLFYDLANEETYELQMGQLITTIHTYASKR